MRLIRLSSPKRLGINQVYKLTLDKRVELLTLFEPVHAQYRRGGPGQPAG